MHKEYIQAVYQAIRQTSKESSCTWEQGIGSSAINRLQKGMQLDCLWMAHMTLHLLDLALLSGDMNLPIVCNLVDVV